ncbi:MAG: ATP synthase A1 subunit C [archaeon]|nr:ATP synthase A1 subunit C [archaeon]
MFGRRRGGGNYAYITARVKAKRSFLLKEDSYQKMLLMNLPEISNFIDEAGYPEIAEFADEFDGVNLIEHATYANMARLFRDILKSTTGELHNVLAATLGKWDIWNLRVILRSKLYGISSDDIKKDLVLAGCLSADKLERLMALDSEEDVVRNYGKMTGTLIPENLLVTFKEQESSAPIEDFLEKSYYKNLLKHTNPKSRPVCIYRNFVRSEIDVINIETILKLKLEGIYGEDVTKYIIHGGKKIDERLATRLANVETISAMMNDLTHLKFYDDIKEVLGSDINSLSDIAAGMKRYRMRMARSFSHLYPLSVIPVIDYLIRKENEVNNIRIVARGIKNDLDRNTIEGLLVI